MGLFDALIEVVKIPLSVAQDVVDAVTGDECDNTVKNIEKIVEELEE